MSRYSVGYLLGGLQSPRNCMEAKVDQQKPARTRRQRMTTRKVDWEARRTILQRTREMTSGRRQ